MVLTVPSRQITRLLCGLGLVAFTLALLQQLFWSDALIHGEGGGGGARTGGGAGGGEGGKGKGVGGAATTTTTGRPGLVDGRRLHLLVPATSTNHHLCQLMISAAILGYPAPVLVNWGQPDHPADQTPPDTVQHQAKVEGVLGYLRALPRDAQERDLVLVADGFDAWFQLPPATLARRYDDAVARAARRHVDAYGERAVAAHAIRDTVLFGPDKACRWEPEDRRAACWAVPDANLPPLAFGPDTDRGIADHRRARWLDSGTVMGPAREVADVFQAALDDMRARPSNGVSDQFYFAEVFAVQSVRRRLLKLERDRALGLDVGPQEALLDDGAHERPPMPDDRRSEYFVGLDHDSALVQTVAFYEDYVTWVRHNLSSQYVLQQSRIVNPHHHFVLPEDLVGGSPLSTGSDADADAAAKADAGLPAELSAWDTLPLLTNTVTKTVPAMVHFTGKKPYRDMWWPRNWFFPHQRSLLERARRGGAHQVPAVDADPASSSGRKLPEQPRPAVAGAWTFSPENNQLGWVGWSDGLCGQFEERLQQGVQM